MCARYTLTTTQNGNGEARESDLIMYKTVFQSLNWMRLRFGFYEKKMWKLNGRTSLGYCNLFHCNRTRTYGCLLFQFYILRAKYLFTKVPLESSDAVAHTKTQHSMAKSVCCSLFRTSTSINWARMSLCVRASEEMFIANEIEMGLLV